jgi:uroporphyrin-III C-methyltransferase/precorrin-2 dehydrogenase/sirohydrochlorin ferrochelatase
VRDGKHWTDYHPVYLDLSDRRILIVGGGSIALEKLLSLLYLVSQPQPSARHPELANDLGPPHAPVGEDAHAPVSEPTAPRITVVSPEAVPEIRDWHAAGLLHWEPREFQDADVDDAYMVIAATDDPELNAHVFRLGDAANRLTNSVDDPSHCNFIMAALGRRGPMQIAVSSAGCSPALAQRIRRRIMSEILTEEVGDLAHFLGARRPEVKDRLPGYRVRQAFWERVIASEIPEMLQRGRREEACRRFEEMLSAAVTEAPGDFAARAGKVYLVGAGPGDPELITLRAVRALQRADVVLYDRLVDPRLLEHAPSNAERVYVGKEVGRPNSGRQSEISAMMVEHAAAGRVVVRLKGGDPFVFGRGGEEMIALHAAGIECEVVPGVTSAIAAPEAAGIPVTHRGVATSFAVFAGHEAEGRDEIPWDVAARIPTALFLMGVERLPSIVANLLAAGQPHDTPVAVVSNATLPNQVVVRATLATITPLAANIPSPAVIVVGEVVNIADMVDARPPTTAPSAHLARNSEAQALAEV